MLEEHCTTESAVSMRCIFGEKSIYSTQFVAEISFSPKVGTVIHFKYSEKLFEYNNNFHNLYLYNEAMKTSSSNRACLYFPRALMLPPSAHSRTFFCCRLAIHRHFGRDSHMVTFASDKRLGLEEIEQKVWKGIQQWVRSVKPRTVSSLTSEALISVVSV
jgi:hypothetical protein